VDRLTAGSFPASKDAMPAAVVIDGDWRILAFNQAAETLFAKAGPAIRGRRLEEIAGSAGWLTPLFTQNAPFNGKTISLSLGPWPTPVTVDASPIPGPDGRAGALIVFKPAGEQTGAGRRLQQLEALAAIGEIAAGAIHEIRNPLTSISGFVQLLKTRAAREKDQTAIHYCTLITEEINHIDNILADFLTLAKPQEMKFAKINLTQIIADVLKLLYGEAVLSQIAIIPKLPAEPLWVQGNGEKIKEALINICRNAFQAMAGAGTLTIAADADAARIRVTVADTGPGIAETVIGEIFAPFFTTKETGTGLGLAICQRIMREHNGEISVASQPGRGATFTLTFPRLPDAD